MSETETEISHPRSFENSFIGDSAYGGFIRYEDSLMIPPIPNEYKISYAPTMVLVFMHFTSPFYHELCFVGIQIRKLRLSMENYRELMIHINSILLWEKQWHPSAIIGGCTSFFMLLWLSDPSLLTILSLLGMLITLADYLLPTIISSIFKADAWTPGKQKQYEDICTNIILYKTKFELLLASYYRMRVTNPKMYLSLTIFGLAILAWIGGTVSNLFLTYVSILLVLLLPGMAYNGFLNKGFETLSKVFADLVENAKSKVGQKKIE